MYQQRQSTSPVLKSLPSRFQSRRDESQPSANGFARLGYLYRDEERYHRKDWDYPKDPKAEIEFRSHQRQPYIQSERFSAREEFPTQSRISRLDMEKKYDDTWIDARGYREYSRNDSSQRSRFLQEERDSYDYRNDRLY